MTKFMDDEGDAYYNIVSDIGYLWRGHTNSWLRIKVLMQMDYDAWEEYAEKNFTGWALVGLLKIEDGNENMYVKDIEEDEHYDKSEDEAAEDTEHVAIDYALYVKLKDIYKEAVRLNQKVLDFEGRTILLDYAKHLIEFLDTQFEGR